MTAPRRLFFMHTWDADKRQYVNADGTVVAPATVRGWIDDFAALLAVLFAERSRTIIAQFQAGTLELAALQAWFAANRRDIADSHRAAVIIAFGGAPQMTETDWQEADRAVNFQTSFFDAFAAQLFSGQTRFDGAFPARAALYAESVFCSYENAVRRRELNAGMDEERRIVRAGDNCETCVAQGALNWQPIGTLKIIGDSECRARCRCYFKFRKSPVNLNP